MNSERRMQPPHFERLTAQVVGSLTAPILSDSLDAVGARRQVMGSAVTPLSAGSRAIGRAHTAQFVPTEGDSDDPYGEMIDFIDALTPGSVAVIATGKSGRSAFWGELFSAAAVGRQASGVVCDGPARDSPRIRQLGFPVFSSGTRPSDFRARMRLASTGEQVECGGVLVSPADLVMADDDGVVVVPRALEGEVLRLAEARVTAERGVLAELLAGARLREVWERWHVL
jgi:4-hydroxy-4-methyl-2-oxoglutarate aldolase